MEFFDILGSIMAPNYDNGIAFTHTERIEKIDALLWDSGYRRINFSGLYYLYAKCPIEKIKEPILVSSHIDCVMSKCFTAEWDDGMVLGTYDNCITNAAILYLMLNGRLSDRVIVAFTGDEEVDSRGARQLVSELEKKNKTPTMTIVLDVTDMGWEEQALFTIENNFWSDGLGKCVVAAANRKSEHWRFVPSDLDELPTYVDPNHVIYEEAQQDESWEYDEFDWECFSLCLPIDGPMHDNEGVLTRKSSCIMYIEALSSIIDALSE